MKVPFIFEILQYDQENPLYSWIFYRLFQIAKNNNCIIAQENHYQSIDEKKRNYFHENSKLMGYKLPKNEDLKEAKKYQITNGETRKILSKYNSRYEAARTLIVKRDQDFEQILEDKINKIESFIEFSIKQYMRIKTIKDDLVYEHVKEMMFKKFDIRNKIYDSKSCHSTCSFLSTSDGLCKYNFNDDKDLPLYFLSKLCFSKVRFSKTRFNSPCSSFFCSFKAL